MCAGNAGVLRTLGETIYVTGIESCDKLDGGVCQSIYKSILPSGHYFPRFWKLARLNLRGKPEAHAETYGIDWKELRGP